MATNNYKAILDFVLNLQYNKAEVDKIAKNLEKQIGNIAPEFDFDADVVEREFKSVLKQIDLAKKEGKDFFNILSDLTDNLAPEDIKHVFAEINNNFDDFSKIFSGDIDALKDDFNDFLSFNAGDGEAFETLDDLWSELNKFEGKLLDLSDIDPFESISGDDPLEDFDDSLEDVLRKIDDIDFDNFDSIEDLEDEFTNVKDEINSVIKEQKKLIEGMDKAGKSGTEEYEKLAKEVDEAEKQVKQLEDAFVELKDNGSFTDDFFKFEAIGEAAGILGDFADKGKEAHESLRLVQAQAGLTDDQMRELEKSSDAVFKSGGIDNYEDGVRALGVAYQLLGDSKPAEEIENMTTQATKLAKVYDLDVNEVLLKSAPFIKQFGLEGQEAFELITYGMQNGLTTQDDFLDSIAEYAPQFKQAGASAGDLVQILTKANKDGVFNTDFNADAYKEGLIALTQGDFATRYADIADQLPSAFRESIDEMAKLRKDGEATTQEFAKFYTQKTAEAYREGLISEDLTGQLQAALFGTKAEDLTVDITANLFEAQISTEDLEAEAQRAGEQLENAVGPQNLFQRTQKELELMGTKLSAAFSPYLSSATSIVETTTNMMPAVQAFQSIDVSKLKGQFASLTKQMDNLPGVFGKSGKALTSLGNLGSNVAGKLGGLANVAFGPWGLAIAGATAALTLFFTKTEKGQELFARLSDGVQKLIKRMEPVFDGLLDTLEGAGYFLFALGEIIYEWLITPIEIGIEIISALIETFFGMRSEAEGSVDVFELLGSVFTKLGESLSTLADFLRGMRGAIQDTKAVIIGFVRGLPEILQALWEYAKYYLNFGNLFGGGDEELEEKLTANLVNSVKGAVKKAKEETEKEKIELTAEINENIPNDLKVDKKTPEYSTGDATNEKAKTALQLADEAYKKQVKSLDIEKERFALAQDQQINSEDRKRTLEDDLILENQRLLSLQEQRNALQESYKIVTDANGEIVSIGVKGADKEEIQSELLSINREIFDKSGTIEQIKLDVVARDDEVQKAIDELNALIKSQELEELQLQIDLGNASAQSLKPFVDDYKTQIASLQTELDSITGDDLEALKQRADLHDKIKQKRSEMRTLNEKIYSERLNQIEKESEKEEEAYEFRQGWLNSFLDGLSNIDADNSVYGVNISARLQGIDTQEADQLDMIDGLLDKGLIDEEEFQSRKEAIQKASQKRREEAEEEHQKRLRAIQAMNYADALLQEEEQSRNELDILSQKIKVLEEKKAEANGDTSLFTGNDELELENLKNQENELVAELERSSLNIAEAMKNVGTAAMGAMGESIADGNIGAMKDVAREQMAFYAQKLQAKIEGMIIDFLTSPSVTAWASALPFPLSLGLIPLAKQLITPAIKSITNPLIAKMLSFSTGGAVSSPTPALIGDASGSGSKANTEWIFRQEDIMAMVSLAAEMSNKGLINEVRQLRNDIKSLQITTDIQARQLRIMIKNDEYAEAKAGY
jgi:phage-related minor tail protein